MTTQTPSSAPDLPVDMIIFGGAGDLSARKLLPALYMAHLHCNLPRANAHHHDRPQATGRASNTCSSWKSSRNPSSMQKALDPQAWDTFLGAVRLRAHQHRFSRTTICASRKLRARTCCRVFYLATSPDLFTTICDNLAAAGLVDGNSRVVLEKPLGHDLASAQAINASVGTPFRRSADLPDRPLPRQGNGAEPDGAALRQRDLRAAVAGAVHQERADHGGGNRRRGQPRGLLRPDRRVARHGAEPPAATAVHRGHGAARVARSRTPCATKNSRCCARCAR